jgi:glycerol-3-phosphate cytidylyltransferase-like family protein
MPTYYIPMTVNTLVVGHVRIIKKVQEKGNVIIGLLTSKALKGYKKEVTPYKDRLEMMQALDFCIDIVPQDSLDPFKNLKEYGCDYLVSGDGFEPIEKEAAKKLGVKLLKVNSGSKIHSSDIK